jgi:hypothetical protein
MPFAAGVSLPQVIASPFQSAADWCHVWIGDVRAPGFLKRGGLQGFDRKTEWDVKKGKGAKGATLSLIQQPPAEGSFTFMINSEEVFQQWAFFLPLLRYDEQTGTAADAVDIYYPALAELGIRHVVTKQVGPLVHVGAMLYERTIEFIEWRPVPPLSIVSTPSHANTPTNGLTDVDPISDAKQAIIAAQNAQIELLNKGAKP